MNPTNWSHSFLEPANHRFQERCAFLVCSTCCCSIFRFRSINYCIRITSVYIDEIITLNQRHSRWKTSTLDWIAHLHVRVSLSNRVHTKQAKWAILLPVHFVPHSCLAFIDSSCSFFSDEIRNRPLRHSCHHCISHYVYFAQSQWGWLYCFNIQFRFVLEPNTYNVTFCSFAKASEISLLADELPDNKHSYFCQ